MKSTKTKVVAGVIAVGMVASMGTAFAATDAGGQLTNWYNAASTSIKGIITGEFTAYSDDAKADHKNTVDGIIKQSRENIRDLGIAEKNDVNAQINAQVTTYTTQISNAQSSIQSNIGSEFDTFVGIENGKTSDAVNAIGLQNQKDLGNAIRNHQNWYADTYLVNETNITHAAAKTTLETAISTAKGALNDSLATEQGIAATELQNHLDGAISSLQGQLNDQAADGVAAAKVVIEAKGEALLETSLSALDAIVDGIDE
ncbi:hypothetical protein ACX1C1_07780 [Paenibacillus sp. strain BS8-2]